MKKISLKSGRSIALKESCKLSPGKFKINDPRSKGAVRITGKNVEVDFAGVELASTTRKQSDYTGIGILVENARDVVIRNARVSGYKYNIVVKNSSPRGMRMKK